MGIVSGHEKLPIGGHGIRLVAIHAPEDNLMWGDDEGPLAFCINLLRDADQ
ncbi:hypothetical protein [Arthrobacter sp. HLT1-21]